MCDHPDREAAMVSISPEVRCDPCLSPHVGFGEMTPPRGYEPPPPAWPIGPDPRTPECRHDWSTEWGQRGERQHQCNHCGRWTWERAIWSARS